MGSILPVFPAGAKKLLILGIDGCRPDALLKCKAPHLRRLAENGTYTWHALSRPPTKSGPCWSSIFTGVWNAKHGVTDNTFSNSHFDRYPMLFQRLKAVLPDFYSGWFVYWPDLATRMPHGASMATGDWSDARTLEKAKELLGQENTDALFVHFGGIDAVGHAVGFDPNQPQYLREIEKVDSLVGEVLSQLKARPHYDEEDWMVIALSDHGGFQTHHGGSTIEEMRVFFIVSGNGVPRQEYSHQWIEREYPVPSYGIALDGMDDAMVIPDTSSLHLGQTFTIELHVCTSGWSGEPVLLANKDMQNEKAKGFALVLIDEGKWRVHVADGEKSKTISGPVIADGLWHHLAVVFGEDKKLKLYQDGIFTGALDISEMKNVGTGLGITIGQDISFSRTQWPRVQLNEIRIWNKALSDSVLAQWMFTPITELHPEFSQCIGYWKLNENFLDSGPHGLHATFHGGNPQWIFPNETVHTLVFDSCLTLMTVDLVPIALSHFGISILPQWGLDGKNIIPLDTSGTGVYEETAVRRKNDLFKIWPNPSHTRCRIWGDVSGHVMIYLYDILGRRMAVLYEGEFPPSGVELDVPRVSTGLYFLRIFAQGKDYVIKMNVVR